MLFGMPRDGLIAGGIPMSNGSRGHIAHLWGEQSGVCLDADKPDLQNPDNLVNVPPVFEDKYIEYWSTVYLNNGLADLGILLDTFLQYPNEIIRALIKGAHGFRPLLAAQRRVYVQQITADEALSVEAAMLPADARLRDGGYTAPFKHHTYKTSRNRNRATR